MSPSGLARPSVTGEITSAMFAPRNVSISRPADSAARNIDAPTNPTVKPTAASRARSKIQKAVSSRSGKAGITVGRHSAESASPSPMRT